MLGLALQIRLNWSSLDSILWNNDNPNMPSNLNLAKYADVLVGTAMIARGKSQPAILTVS
jgi:hypothetical protein